MPFGILQMEDIGKAVMKYPGLLGTGINKIDRTIGFLKAAGVVEISKCICRHPQVHPRRMSNLDLNISKDIDLLISLIDISSHRLISVSASTLRRTQFMLCYS